MGRLSGLWRGERRVTCLTKYRPAYEDMHRVSLLKLLEVFAAGDPALRTPELQGHRLRHAKAVWTARAAMRAEPAREV
ncbi:hypothetical protein [Streptomyces sp. NPDC001450]